MNSTSNKGSNRIDWREDLLASRDLSQYDMVGYAFLLGWLENWRVSKHLQANRDTAVRFWRECVSKKKRSGWQTDQWAEAIR